MTNEVLHIFGLKRAGNHFITNMLAKNAFPNKTVYWGHKYNDVYSPSSNPPRLALPSEIAHPNATSINTSIILSYENVHLSMVARLPSITNQQTILTNASSKFALVLRDPKNFIASYLRLLDNYLARGDTHLPLLKVPIEDIRNLWIEYAKEAIGETKFLGNNMIFFNYNRWVLHEKYRNSVLKKYFGITNNMDLGLNKVLNYGEGSSFDQTRFDKQGSKMKVMDRWKCYQNDTRYLNFISNSQIKKCADKLGFELNKDS